VSPGGDLQNYARAAALQAGIDPDIFFRQIQQESGFNPKAKSGAGAVGIAQFMPGTAAGLGIDPTDPYASLDAAARMDAQNLKQYGGDWSRTLAAYNAGPGAVAKYGGVPPYEETQRYVNTILGSGPAQPTAKESLSRLGTGFDQQQSQYVFPVPGFQGKVQDHWGEVLGGSDLFAARGTPALAMRGGKVLESGWNSVGGNSVLIQGDDGNQYYYAHLDDAPSVKVGQTVPAGAYLGPIGDTGDAKGTGTHLHIGIGPDIRLGADKYGGTGGDYNAVGLLQRTLDNTANAPAPTVSPSQNPSQNPAQVIFDQASNAVSTAGSTVQRAVQPVVDAVSGAIGGAGALGNEAVRAISQAGADARANQASQLPGGAFNRLAPGSEGGPPQYTDFGQAAAASGPTPADVYTVQPGGVQKVLDQVTGVPGLSNVIDWQQQQRQAARDVLIQAGIDPDAGIFSSKPEVDPLGTLTSAPQQILSGPQQGNWGLGGTLGGVLGLAGLATAGQTPAGSSGAAARAAETALGGLERAFPPDVAHAATAESPFMSGFGPGGAVPTTGATLLKRAIDTLSTYPEEIAAPIRDFAATVDAPSSQIATTIMRWIQDNPMHTVPDVSAGPVARAAAADVGQQAVEDLVDSIRSRPPAYRPGGPGPESGQLGLESLPTVGSPEAGRLAEASPEVASWQSRTAAEGRAGQEPLPAGVGESGVPEVTPGQFTPYQRALQSGTGGLQQLIDSLTPGQFRAYQRAFQPGTGGLQQLIDSLTPGQFRAYQRAFPEGSGGLQELIDSLTPGQFRAYNRALQEAPAGSGSGGLLQQLVDATNSGDWVSQGLPRGVTADMVDAAHAKLENLTNSAGEKVPIPMGTHGTLDSMLARGAKPDELARWFAALRGDKPSIADWVRSLRTGSMAGGLATEGKVALGPIIQTAMRAPAGALHLVMTGRAGEIPRGLQGGLSGLMEGAHEGLQTIRYGTNYRSVLTSGAGGGYGFRPGPSVIGGTPFQRALGTVLEGLVRTHGAVGDVSAGIGRGANRALGASAKDAAEAGQQWAFRSGEYGFIGSRMAKMFDTLRGRNPALDIVSQIVLPFYRVAYNVFTQGVERSPVGLAGRITDAMQGKPLDQAKLANNLFGVWLAGIALTEASQGNITADHPEGGAPKNSIRIAGQWLPLRALGSLSEPLAQAAITYESARDSRGNTGKFALQLASSYAGHVMDETWLNSIHDVFDTLGAVRDVGSENPGAQSKAAKDLEYLGKSYGKSFIPQEKLGEQVLGLVNPKGAGSGSPSRPPGTLPVYKPGAGAGSLPVYKPSSFPKVGAGR